MPYTTKPPELSKKPAKVNYSKSSGFAAKSIGNLFFQPKLAIAPSEDKYEQEADAVAERVMMMSNNSKRPTFFPPVVRPVTPLQRKCTDCEEEEKEKVRRKEANAAELAPSSSSLIEKALSTNGQPLDQNTKSFMENRFGYDFSQVRIHTDQIAAKSASAINALAYTSGNDIVFNQGQYAPGISGGKQLLAHELTHVVQQDHKRPKMVRRQGASSAPAAPAVNTTATSPHGRNCSQANCADEDRAVMNADLTRAQNWVSAARRELAAQPISERTGQLLNWYFNSQSPQTINTLDTRLECIHNSLAYAQTQSWWGCDPPYDATAYADMVAAVGFCANQRDLICLTDSHFDNSPPRRSTTLIHEAAHLQGFSLGVLDHGASFPDIYSWKPNFQYLSTEGSLQNADSVAYFCRAIATGVTPSFRFLLEGGAGFGTANDAATWAARLFIGTEMAHPVLGIVNPRIGLGFTVIGEELEPPTSPLLSPRPDFILSALVGLRLADPRPGPAGTGFATFEAGPSVILGRNIRPGAELGVSIGYRWRFLEFSSRLGTIIDPNNREGLSASVVGTGGLGLNF